jgi:hypothetical protein
VSRLLLHSAARHAGIASQIYWGLAAAADAAASGLSSGGSALALVVATLQAALLSMSGGRLRWMILNQHKTGDVWSARLGLMMGPDASGSLVFRALL